MRGDVVLDWGRRIGWGEAGVGTGYLIGAVELDGGRLAWGRDT